MKKSRKITVIGSANIDLIMKLDRLPRPAETVAGGAFMQAHGGKGANQAVAAARAGQEVAFVGCVGDDSYGRQIISNLRAAGIDADGIHSVPGVPTGTALILVNEKGENMIGVAPGANSSLGPDRVAACRGQIESSCLVMIQMEIPIPAVAAAVELAGRAGVPVMLNFAPAAPPQIEIGESIAFLVANELETEALIGKPVHSPADALAAAAQLAARGPRAVIVTLGADGAAFAEKERSLHIPAFPVEAVDATAAGDTFCGALAAAIVEGHSLFDAVRFASAAAALCTTRMGAQPSIPCRSDIEGFLDERD